MSADFRELGRFTDISLLILLSLADGPKHGYAMLEDIERFSGTQLEPGTLYGALMRVEKKGWIALLPAVERRHPYCLTELGAIALRSQIATLERLVTTGHARLAFA